jgi:hypothetical protein
MKTFRIIGMVLMVIIMGVNFTSCKPNNNEEETTKKLVKFCHGNNETILKYDDQGHFIEYSEVMGLDSVFHTYTYTYVWKENAIEITLSMDGVAMENCTLDLENGLASGISDNPLVFTSSFKYNSANRLIESTNFMGTQSIEWNDDKFTATCSNSLVNTKNESFTYEKNYTTKGYNPLIPYTISSTEMLYVAHPELAGLATQKLFNSENSISIMNDKEYTFSYKYEYGFDEDGYVNKVIVRHNEEDCEHIVSEYTFVWE